VLRLFGLVDGARAVAGHGGAEPGLCPKMPAFLYLLRI
jgi:hypothetical protein